MNRRTFFGSLATLAATAYVSPKTWVTPPVHSGFQQVYFKGIPLKFSQHAPSSQIYFIGRRSNGTYVFSDREDYV